MTTANTRLGKLRQWAGDVISSKDKDSKVNEDSDSDVEKDVPPSRRGHDEKADETDDELKTVDKDIEFRKAGMQRLQNTSRNLHHAISKTKARTSDGKTKVLPYEDFGGILAEYGEDLTASPSPYGAYITQIGQAHIEIASLQATFAHDLDYGLLIALERQRDTIKDWEALKKKTERRKSSLESALTKLTKLQSEPEPDNDKKLRDLEKRRSDAEAEVHSATDKYDDTNERLEEKTRRIREGDSERDLIKDLETFIDAEIELFKGCKNILHSLIESKPSPLRRPSPPRLNGSISKKGSSITIGSHKSANSISTSPVIPPRPPSVRSRPQSRQSLPPPSRSSTPSFSRATALAARQADNDSEPDDPPPKRRSDSMSGSISKLSRPSSRSSNKRGRSDSNATATGDKEPDKENKSKEDKEKDRSKRMSISGWASLPSIGIGKKKLNQDNDNFSTLHDSENQPKEREDGRKKEGGGLVSSLGLRRKLSSRSATDTGLVTERDDNDQGIYRPEMVKDARVVRAIHSFAGSKDELSFDAGQDILVVNEVLEEWWMGEIVGTGKKGLFPSSYVEDKITTDRRLHDHGDGQSPSDAENEAWHAKPLSPGRSPFYYSTFGHHIDRGDIPDSDSLASVDEPHEDENRKFNIRKSSELPADLTGPERRHSLKKAPPPPPPRRSTMSSTDPPPPLPQRRLSGVGMLRAHSYQNSLSGSSMSSNSGTGTDHSSADYTTSPFESAADVGLVHNSGNGGCSDFRQNPFKAKGFCSNCQGWHT